MAALSDSISFWWTARLKGASNRTGVRDAGILPASAPAHVQAAQRVCVELAGINDRPIFTAQSLLDSDNSALYPLPHGRPPISL